jgi:hypothetical protein
MSVRSGLYALAFLLTGAFLFISVMLCSIAFLAARNCGPAFGYFGCETPVTHIGNEGHQVAATGAVSSHARSTEQGSFRQVFN